jgi:F-type H+-transporting ATPase subunit b
MTQTTSSSVESAGRKTFPPLDPGTFASQLVWFAIAFGLLYLLLQRAILPSVGKVIQGRSDRIKKDLALAEELQAETQAALTSYEQALADARSKALALARAFHAEVAAEIEKDRARAQAEIAAKLADADRRISEAKSNALAGISDIASDVAQSIVARLTAGGSALGPRETLKRPAEAKE